MLVKVEVSSLLVIADTMSFHQLIQNSIVILRCAKSAVPKSTSKVTAKQEVAQDFPINLDLAVTGFHIQVPPALEGENSLFICLNNLSIHQTASITNVNNNSFEVFVAKQID